jgi:thioredoxin-related protein
VNYFVPYRRQWQHDSALELLLKKSARYCENLKKVIFNFTCTKEVIDNHWYWGCQLKDDYYLYHYQMVREENGEMNEERRLKRRLKRGLIRRYIPESTGLLEKKKKK